MEDGEGREATEARVQGFSLVTSELGYGGGRVQNCPQPDGKTQMKKLPFSYSGANVVGWTCK